VVVPAGAGMVWAAAGTAVHIGQAKFRQTSQTAAAAATIPPGARPRPGRRDGRNDGGGMVMVRLDLEGV
jgi:hypothetical protein